MSSRGTGASSLMQKYCCLSLEPQALCSRLREIARLDSVAEWSFTGIEYGPNEIVNDAIDLAAMLHLIKSITCVAYFARKVRRILHYACVRLSARPRSCFRASTSPQRSSVCARRPATFVILKSSGCALASSSQLSGSDTGAPGAPRGE